MTERLTCNRCSKRLSRKTARQIDGEVMCSACLFAPRDSGSGPSGRRHEVAPGEAPQSGLSEDSGIAQTPVIPEQNP